MVAWVFVLCDLIIINDTRGARKNFDVPKMTSRGARKNFDVPKTRARTEIRAEWEILGTTTTPHLDSDYTRPHPGPN